MVVLRAWICKDMYHFGKPDPDLQHCCRSYEVYTRKKMRIWFRSELSVYHMNGYWVPYLYPGQVADKVGTDMYPGQVVEVQDVGALSVYSQQVVKAAPRCILTPEPVFQIFR
jgi:hypothetical protein